MSAGGAGVDGEQGPSRHLGWHELACRDGTPYPKKWRGTRAVKLGTVFEAVRRACDDRPLAIASGYRTVQHNRQIGGARKSQHVEGRAVDIRTPRGLTREDFHERVRTCCREHLAAGGVGYYPWGVHVDTRPRGQSGRLASWGKDSALKDG